MTDENAAAPEPAPTPEDQAPRIRVLAQYVKDLSFENPGAPNTLRSGVAGPQIELALDVGARRREDGYFEVELRIKAEAKHDDKVSFIIELLYAGLFQFDNAADDLLDQLVLIEAPRMLFPFARRIVADTTRDGGYPPLQLDPIDFTGLYLSQRQKQSEGLAGPVGQTPPASETH